MRGIGGGCLEGWNAGTVGYLLASRNGACEGCQALSRYAVCQRDVTRC